VCRVEVAAAVGHEKPTAAARVNIKRRGDRRTRAQPCIPCGGRYPQVLILKSDVSGLVLFLCKVTIESGLSTSTFPM
jgi:hypothetical protein